MHETNGEIGECERASEAEKRETEFGHLAAEVQVGQGAGRDAVAVLALALRELKLSKEGPNPRLTAVQRANLDPGLVKVERVSVRKGERARQRREERGREKSGREERREGE
jgi:hypothetical protein